MRNIKGAIFVNAYSKPSQSITQAQNLQQEFIKKGIGIDIITDGFLLVRKNKIKEYSFGIFLDKDKYLSKQLENLGLRLFNSHDAIRICDDKGETCIALEQNGIKTPKTFFAPVCYRKESPLNEDWLKEIEKELKYPIIIKGSFGSMGSSVYKAENYEELKEISEEQKLNPHIYQQMVGESGVDYRVICIGKQAVSCMKRVNKTDFRSNIALGGVGEKIELERVPHLVEVANTCAKVLNLDYCGVDLLVDETGVYVCEVNSNAFFEESKRVTGVNIAKLYVEYILENI
ncbi:MAG: RimK family alpha-L-glutamate ligase [Clostridia bacterium]|nr:RimK family alpha-L-glutamate ligase [Clostridia bacterium]